jgi:hypothetical protein
VRWFESFTPASKLERNTRLMSGTAIADEVQQRGHPDRNTAATPSAQRCRNSTLTPSMEEHAIVSDASAIGCVGTLVVATRGDRGPGEVVVTVRGAKEALLAWSDEPLPKGSKVLVVEVRGARTVVVEPWKDLA